MSTVPKADTPAPANNAKTLTLKSDPNLYVRPTAGGNASGDNVGGATGSSPDYSINRPGAAPTDAGPDMGHGSTKIMAEPDATGAARPVDGGTV